MPRATLSEALMTKYRGGEKKHIDPEKVAQHRKDKHDARWLLDHGTVEEYEMWVRGINPELTNDEMRLMRSAFFEQRAARQLELRMRPSPPKRGA
jgi:hypothetical protein